MNSRERWLACMRFEPVDHVPDQEFGYWVETFEVWHQQGLPEYIDNNTKADIYFGFEPALHIPVNGGIIPGFDYKIVEEDERHRIIVDYDGATKQIYKDGSSSIPHFIKFPIETRDDWNEFKKRLDPSDASRYPAKENLERWKQQAAESGRPVCVNCGSLFGRIRDWMGFENIAIACMDDPAWIEEMIDYCTEFHYEVVKRAIEDVRVDLGAFWEDMAFNHGPIISPKLFKQWLTPRYAKIMQLLNSNGCDFAYVDCDGNINSIVEYWLEAGVNIMFPLEVRGGTDPVELRKRFGQEIRLAGGVDKTQLIAGKDAIDKELERLRPVVEEGGYIPHVDHRCPPDVTFENYLYYLKRKREILGIPEPAPWEERREHYDWAK